MQEIQKENWIDHPSHACKAGWTQDIFADRSGLNRAHVGEIERGESNVTIHTLKIVADTLGVRIS